MQIYKKLRGIAASLFVMCSLYACKKEAAIQPVPNPPFYTLPQGDQPYDDSIVAFRNQYSSYILYKFTNHDLLYEVTGNVPRLAAKIANPPYIDTTLKLFKTVFMNYFPEEFLKKTMPYKILLAASIDTMNVSAITKLVPSITGTFATATSLVIGWADSAFLKKKYPARTLREWVTAAYFKNATLGGAIKIPLDFVKLAPPAYNTATSDPRGMGFLGQATQMSDISIYWDFGMYVAYISSRTRAELNNTIFKPNYDTKGMVRKKYEVVCNFFQTEYGIDLQAIGERP
ncbi:hypothetical protein [Chitinophaga sp. sic0106]|uniref:hypothetical protein n=1 Tax=Chitinophaga sp. sic0106 TaxID=2854785 RepID=UPI001C448508|nr:hypothetical protein [Chitinophaga sp. sic0106]MBV7531026.1 hypothetical protein [Chitinophaga sp. sic0106]